MRNATDAVAMASRVSVVILVVTFLVILSASSAQAQRISVGPAPGSTPVLSPYLDLLRTDGGVLPNYQQFVRPRIQLRDTLNRQQQAINREAQSARAINRRVSSLRDASGLTTGVRTGFMRYSTFYPGLQQR